MATNSQPRKSTSRGEAAPTASAAPMPETDAFIDPSEIVSRPRGRKAIIDTSLVETFRRLPEGKAVRLEAHYGSVPKADQAKVSARIRTAWKVAHPGTMCSIAYTPAGVPQVSRRKA